jgi:hypothetical protein
VQNKNANQTIKAKQTSNQKMRGQSRYFERAQNYAPAQTKCGDIARA